MIRKFARVIAALTLSIVLAGCENQKTNHEHEWVEADCITAKTCSMCNETEGEPLGHIWNDADCKNPKICSVCGETEGEKEQHDWEAATCKKPKTCKKCGETSGSTAQHKWQSATYEKPKTCSVCGKTEGEKLMYTRKDFFDSNENNIAFYLIDQNSAGGIQYLWADKYIGTKEIKYYTLHFSMINSVGDPAYDEITSCSTFNLKYSGPVSSGKFLTSISYSNPEAYCRTINKLSLDTIDFEFMDGSKATVNYGWYTTIQSCSNGFVGIINAIKNNIPALYNEIS